MPSAWDYAADRDLLLAIIDLNARSKIDWHGVSDALKAKGLTFTHEACRQHFQKLRRESKAVGSNGQTPNAKHKAAKRPNTGSAATHEDDRDDSEELDESPLKKVKIKKDLDSIPKKEESYAELGGFRGQNAPQMKQEWSVGDSPIDLENEDIYD